MKAFETSLLRCDWEPGWHCANPDEEEKRTAGMSQEEYWDYQMHEKKKVRFDTLDGLIVTNKGSYDCTSEAAPGVRSSDLAISCPWFEVTAPDGKVISCIPGDRGISCKAK